MRHFHFGLPARVRVWVRTCVCVRAYNVIYEWVSVLRTVRERLPDVSGIDLQQSTYAQCEQRPVSCVVSKKYIFEFHKQFLFVEAFRIAVIQSFWIYCEFLFSSNIMFFVVLFVEKVTKNWMWTSEFQIK